MKKLIYTTLALGLILSLSSFSSIKANKVPINVLDSNSELVLNFEASSFSEFEKGQTAPDKTVWFKRIRYWDISAGNTEETDVISDIITRN